MKFKWWFIPIALGALFVICRLTFIFQFYHVPTASNEPNINAGSYLFATNLYTPKRLEFICYHQAAGDTWPAGIWVKRVCGLPGDNVQLINGNLFVNGKDLDIGLNLKKTYIIASPEIRKLADDYVSTHLDDIHSMVNDSTEAMLETKMVAYAGISGRYRIDTSIDDAIQSVFHHPWTRDNFGPLFIPEGFYFVLGDNRDASVDSRYVGLTAAKDYIGTVFAIIK